MIELKVKAKIYHKVIVRKYNEKYQRWEETTKMESGMGDEGEVYVGLDVAYVSDRKIKYILLTLIPYNAVHDVVGEEKSMKITGPFEATPSNTHGYYLHANRYEVYSIDPLWQDGDINKIDVLNAKILYFNGTEEEIDGNSIIDWKSDDNVVASLSGFYQSTSSEEARYKKANIITTLKGFLGCYGVIIVIFVVIYLLILVCYKISYILT